MKAENKTENTQLQELANMPGVLAVSDENEWKLEPNIGSTGITALITNAEGVAGTMYNKLKTQTSSERRVA